MHCLKKEKKGKRKEGKIYKKRERKGKEGREKEGQWSEVRSEWKGKLKRRNGEESEGK